MVGFISQNTAMGLTKAILLTLLAFFGFVSRRLSGGGVLPSIISGIVITLLGYALIQIKLWIKYLPTIGH